jgi:F-type H+-transporting ATPase subunit b
MADLLIFATLEERGFGINPNFWETNIFNIVIFVGVLVYLGRGVVGKILTERRQSIETLIREAEERKQQALEQLAQEQQKLAQAQAACEAIRQKAEADAMALKEGILATTQAEIDRIKALAEQEIRAEQARVQLRLKQETVEHALAEVRAYLDRGLSDQQHQQLIEGSIARL